MKRILFILSVVATLSSCSLLYGKLGGDYTHGPQEVESTLSPEAKKLVEDSFKGIDPSKLIDQHVHLVGLGKGGTGIEVNKRMRMWWKHLGKYNRFNVYKSASGIKHEENADREYVERLVSLVKYFPVKIHSYIFAFDRHYNEDGTPNEEHTEFYVPNEYVVKVAKEFPKYFSPVVSVHPYRKDALVELEKWGKQGVKFVKWLPNAMGMDPAKESNIRFYKMMKKYGMTLISHAGEEKAVEGDKYQELGNPLKLRLPLDLGLKVVIAHMASRGPCLDYDNNNAMIDCSKLFWRMFDNKKYEKNLFSETSSLLIYERIGEPLNEVIERTDVHHRIGYGSDYPLPGINWIYRTNVMEDMGYINEKERELLNEIYGYNPLLFHFVALRTVKHPKTGQKLGLEAFHYPKGL
ncbi:amidohydrolase family protein [Bacteriovorax sp. Seq25_V]|uniref:amidohydrolase family protein n=1 Tax=Bacteriovorax sp. Seq25_V TaxID=1201288 RepID=UPI000389F4F6|nr:amidohydrolase family protein [Bacteriovorax sp. Seq25_V]EQC43481.1 amidohydrolase family protein [Bacteriovorax sp. Seq25_V]